MRNLKKILALVLALVMSLSLMATASAADFTDASSINDKYETAVEVLEGLGVFRGYQDGSFQPTGSITRAETAAIIYRIVTGDVKDEQVGIYADYNLFTDVPSTAWYAGYVNYCANAEYIKGVGGGKFNPNAKVTGYAALAMILRAIGYTANGGFTGPDWEVQTARTGEARKITKNIMTGTLGQDATRETVAEILFQAILVNMVDHNVLHTQNGQQGYTEVNMTLGYKTFGLEQIEGVVMANEYANLYTNKVLGKDKTQLKVAGEDKARDLAIGTKITDVGESRYAYVTGAKVLAMGDTGKNKVTETGAAVDISSAGKFSAVAGMPAASDIQYYTNFDLDVVGKQWCDQRLEFSVVIHSNAALLAFNSYTGRDLVDVADHDADWVVEETADYTDPTAWTKMTAPYGALTWGGAVAYRFTKIIYAGNPVSNIDLDIIRGIFGTADNKQNNLLPKNQITGDVYVGTKSTPTETDEERDLSNVISYSKFVEDYIKTNTTDDNWNLTWNGWWAKFVDNDGDGYAEYAFCTRYELAEALYTFTDRDGETYLEFNDFDSENWKVRYLDGYTPAVGDKVLAAYIDGQMLVEPAKSETVVVSSYSWRNDEITTDKGTYGQSGIINATDMMDEISNMEDKVEYIVYFDHFGYVRAYELPGGKQYALITEMYYTNGMQGNLVDQWPMTAELTTLEDGETVTKEYNVVSGASTFTAKQPWMLVENAVATYNYNNWLQPVIAHLGVNWTGYAPTKGTYTPAVGGGSNDDYLAGTNAYVTFWNANYQLVRKIAVGGMTTCQEFNFGPQTFALSDGNWSSTWGQTDTASFTNVAVVRINGNDASLAGAASLQLNQHTAQPLYASTNPAAYATEYVQLSTADIAAKAVRYPLAGPGTYAADNNNYVNAVHDTQYFIAYNGGVVSFKDYDKFPGLTNKANQIHAAYAVVRNISSDLTDKPYWVADVIVYEVYDLDDTAQTSVSLGFYTPTRSSGNVQEIETLNTKYGLVTLIPKSLAWSADRGQWGVNAGFGAQWAGYGFYALNNDTEPVDNVMTARSISKITIGNYAKNNIHAGIITREAYIDGAGEYIDVSLGNGKSASIEITNKIYSITTDPYNQSNTWYNINYADLLRYENQTNSQVRKGDCVIWVGGAKTDGTKSSTNFVVDLGSSTDWSNKTTAYCGVEMLDDTASFLIDTYPDALGNPCVTGLDNGAGYAYATNTDGVWQQIMKEQNAPAASFTVSVGSVVTTDGTTETAVSDAVKDTVSITKTTFTAAEGKASFAETVSVDAPYVVKNVVVANNTEDGAGKDAQAVKISDTVYQIVNATDDVVLKVTVEKVEKTLAISGAGVTAFQLDGEAWDGAVKTLDWKHDYTITFTPADNTTYALSKDGAPPVECEVEDGKITIAGNLAENTVYTLTKLERSFAVGAKPTNATVAVEINGAAATPTYANTGSTWTVNKGASYKVTVTPNPGYNYTYTVTTNGVAGSATPLPADGVISDRANDNISIAITEAAKSGVTLPEVKLGNTSAEYTAGTKTFAVTIPYGTTSGSVTINAPVKGSIEGVWSGPVTYGTLVDAAADGTYTLAVGSYNVATKAENGDDETYIVTVAAAAANDNTELETVDPDSAIVIVNTSGSEKITLPKAAEGITVAQLKALIKCVASTSTLKVVTATGQTTAASDSATVTATMCVLVTAQDTSVTAEYEIEISAT